jgi:hypothetical protein
LIAPAKARSPLRKVKRDRTILQAAVEKGKTQISLLQAKSRHSKNTIIQLKARNNQLMQDIDRECKASNKIIDEAMSDARKLTVEALVMMREAEIKCSKVDECITAEHNLATTCIHAERMHHSKESVRLQQKLEDRLDKQNCEQDASINQMRPISGMKLHKVRHDMFVISNKLKEQRLVWQNRLAQLDSLTMNHLSKEQVLTEKAKPTVVVRWVGSDAGC